MVQDQPGANRVAEECAGRGVAEFRRIAALGFVSSVLIPGSIAVVEHGLATWVAAAISLVAASTALHRLRKERALLNGRSTTIAVVTHWQQGEGLEGGRSYSVQYRFLGPGGKEYSGKETSHVELPQVGELLPILYVYADPARNLPLATFWFYRFTYTGFAKWMD